MIYPKPVSAAAASLTLGDILGQVFAFSPAITNLCLQSQALNVAPWALGGGVAVTSTNNADPRGGLTFNLLTDASAVATGEATQPITVANNGASYVVSAFVRAGTGARMKLGARLAGGVAVESFIEIIQASGVVSSQQGTVAQQTFVIGGVTFFRLSVLVVNNTSGNVTLTPYFQPASNTVADQGNAQCGFWQAETAPTLGSATPSAYVAAGAAAAVNGAGLFPAFAQAAQVKVESYTAGGTSVAPPWANRALLTGTGAGGGGGASGGTGGAGGGGAGAKTAGTIVTVTAGLSTTVTIGAGGAGSAGAATSFGGLLSLAGGAGGAFAAGAAGGSGGLGGINGAEDGDNGITDVSAITSVNGGNGGRGGRGGSVGVSGPQAGAANSGGGGGGERGGQTPAAAGGSGFLVVIYFKV